jgi:uncharacterized membrane-anchored protein
MTDKPTLRYAATKVPEITLLFWGLKLLTTGMGESISDFLGSHSVPIGGSIGFLWILLAIYLQMRQERFKAGYYWFAVLSIAVFGTMTADAIHDGANLSYPVTSALFGIFAAAVFTLWYRSEGSLDFHTISTRRRERYYWLTIYATFTLGTALGDMTAASMNLGFLDSIFLFSAIILIPLVGWWRLKWNEVFAFWFAYVDTRPIGASFSDWFSKPHNITGLNFGDGPTSLCALVAFVALVVYAIKTEHGIQAEEPHPHHLHHSSAPAALVPEVD